MGTQELLREIKSRLQAAHGARLKGVILYGSRARGDAQPDSDYDVLVLLDGPIRLLPDIQANVDATYPLVLQSGVSIHAMPADVRDYEQGACALYKVVKREGVAV